MNGLERIRKYRLLFLVIGLLFLTSIFYAIFTLIQKRSIPTKLPAPNIILPPGIQKPAVRNIIFQLNETSFPKEVNIYKVTSYSLSEQNALKIAGSLEFKNSPKKSSNQAETLFWQNEDFTKSLFVNLNNGYIEYIYEYRPIKVEIGQPQIPTIKNPNEAITIATDFLSSHNLFPSSLESQNKVSMFLNNLDATPTDSFSNAYYFQVNFKHKLDGLTVFKQLTVDSSVQVTVDKYKNITQLSYQHPTILESSPKKFEVISLDTAKKKLQEGKGTVVNFVPGEINSNINKDIDSTTLFNVELAYLDDRKSGYIQPIYIFRGEAVFENSNKAPVIFYLPAINQ